jgi:hypothetical protein
MQLHRIYGHRIEAEKITAQDDDQLRFQTRPDRHYQTKSDTTKIAHLSKSVQVLEYEGVQLIQF